MGRQGGRDPGQMCRCAPPAGQHTRAPCCWGGGGGHGSEALGQHAHQLVLGARLAHADVLVTLHGDIGEGDGILLHPQVLELQGRGAQGGGRAQQWAAAVAGGRRCSSRRACPAPSRRSNRLGWFAGRGGEPPRSCTTAGRGDRVAAVNDRVTAAGAASGTHVEDLTQAQRWCRHPVDRAGSCSRTLRARALIALPLLFSSPRVQARVELGGPIGGWGAESRQ